MIGFSMIYKYLIILINIFFLISTMCSAETRLGLSSFAINTESELEVRSDSMIFDSESQSTKFIDNVFIKFDKLTLKANSVKILQIENRNENKNIELHVDGPLIISDGNNFIYGDKAIYNRTDQEITISGNVNLIHSKNEITAEKMILNLKNGLAKIIGSVKTVLSPVGTK